MFNSLKSASKIQLVTKIVFNLLTVFRFHHHNLLPDEDKRFCFEAIFLVYFLGVFSFLLCTDSLAASIEKQEQKHIFK